MYCASVASAISTPMATTTSVILIISVFGYSAHIAATVQITAITTNATIAPIIPIL